jgi:tetratricopeptide (TPR) repeat protein
MSTLPSQAEILVTMDRLPEALASMDVAIGYSPWDERLWLFRGGLLDQAGQSAAAIDSFRTAHELAPYSAVVKNALGYTMLNADTDYAEALGLIQEAVAVEPRNPAYLDSLGWAWYRLGDLQAALEQLETAYRLMRDGEVAAHLGEVLWETGQSDIAKAIWAEAIASEPDNHILLETMRRYMP